MRVTLSTNMGTTNLTGTVVVTADPSSPGQVTSVRFYVDDVLKSTDTSSPFNYTWDTATVTTGFHQLKAEAFYPRNKKATARLDVTVAAAPVPPPPPPVQAVPVNVTVPTLSGTATEGQTLTVSPGTWQNSPTSYTRQWLRCDAAGANPVMIPSATGASYVLVAADVGATIRCAVTAYNSFGASAAVQTAQTAVVAALAPAVPVNTTLPVITGSTSQGTSLTVSNGAWTNSPTSYTRQWRRCDSAGAACANITGATSTTYLLTSTDVGSTIRCQVVAVNAAGSSAIATTAQTAVVTVPPPVPPPPTGLPFAEAALRSGYNTLTVPAANQNVTAPAGLDCLIDLQNIERTIGSLLIWGSSGQRIKVINGRWNITKPIDGSPYWRGGPRLRSVDGIGPEHISLTGMLIRGSTLTDGIGISTGSQTRVTIQRCRIESVWETTGANTSEPAEHCDAIQVQTGNRIELNIGLCTLYQAGVASGNDGGKGIQLAKEGGGPFTVNLSSVNIVAGGGRTDAAIVKAPLEYADIILNLTDVWQKTEAGLAIWNWDTAGGGLFVPNLGAGGAAVSWTITGSAPNRIANFPAAVKTYGVVREGRPAGVDFVTRAYFGV